MTLTAPTIILLDSGPLGLITRILTKFRLIRLVSNHAVVIGFWSWSLAVQGQGRILREL